MCIKINERIHKLNSLSDIIRSIRLGRVGWLGTSAPMKEERISYQVLVIQLNEEEHLGDPGVDGSIIL
jgi:hypothetical protein